MPTPPRSSAGAIAAGWARAAEWAPDLRSALPAAIARESEQRRFFLWIPIAAIGGVALNLAADREPALWLPACLAGRRRRAGLRVAPPTLSRAVFGSASRR